MKGKRKWMSRVGEAFGVLLGVALFVFVVILVAGCTTISMGEFEYSSTKKLRIEVKGLHYDNGELVADELLIDADPSPVADAFKAGFEMGQTLVP